MSGLCTRHLRKMGSQMKASRGAYCGSRGGFGRSKTSRSRCSPRSGAPASRLPSRSPAHHRHFDCTIGADLVSPLMIGDCCLKNPIGPGILRLLGIPVNPALRKLSEPSWPTSFWAMENYVTGQTMLASPDCRRICISGRSHLARSGQRFKRWCDATATSRPMPTSSFRNLAGANSLPVVYEYPDLPTVNFRREFDRYPWVQDDAHLLKWQRGLTGYPFVDAGMRELWHTGYIAQPGSNGCCKLSD